MGPPIKYRLSANDLLDTLDNWNSLMNFRVHLIACGGTALTLLKIKDSTRDIDFTVPMHKEYDRLIKFLGDLGYEEKGGGLAHDDDPNFIYQFWCGNKVFTTDLLDSPLEPGKHIPIKRWSHIYLAALNLTDLIITKMFRGTSVDRDDCIAAFATGKVNAEKLLERYSKTARYDLNPEKMMKNFVYLAEGLRELKLISDEFFEKVR
ncbi:MAG: hypothetical protein LJE89_09590 [Deltaproteobacteria bacterium]|nr:hypothetical protein [Deltaproteobacteria bacterium]